MASDWADEEAFKLWTGPLLSADGFAAALRAAYARGVEDSCIMVGGNTDLKGASEERITAALRGLTDGE